MDIIMKRPNNIVGSCMVYSGEEILNDFFGEMSRTFQLPREIIDSGWKPDKNKKYKVWKRFIPSKYKVWKRFIPSMNTNSEYCIQVEYIEEFVDFSAKIHMKAVEKTMSRNPLCKYSTKSSLWTFNLYADDYDNIVCEVDTTRQALELLGWMDDYEKYGWLPDIDIDKICRRLEKTNDMYEAKTLCEEFEGRCFEYTYDGYTHYEKIHRVYIKGGSVYAECTIICPRSPKESSYSFRDHCTFYYRTERSIWDSYTTKKYGYTDRYHEISEDDFKRKVKEVFDNYYKEAIENE